MPTLDDHLVSAQSALNQAQSLLNEAQTHVQNMYSSKEEKIKPQLNTVISTDVIAAKDEVNRLTKIYNELVKAYESGANVDPSLGVEALQNISTAKAKYNRLRTGR